MIIVSWLSIHRIGLCPVICSEDFILGLHGVSVGVLSGIVFANIVPDVVVDVVIFCTIHSFVTTGCVVGQDDLVKNVVAVVN